MQDLKRYKRSNVQNPNRRIVSALRTYEKKLNSFGVDFNVWYDPYKKELLVYSTDVEKVTNSLVYFKSWHRTLFCG